MMRIAAVMLFALAGLATADDKKDDKPALAGTWVREASGLDLTVVFKGKDEFTLTAAPDENNAVTVTCKYTLKDNVVKAKITKVAVKGEFKNAPKDGLELSFKWKVKGDTASLDDFEMDGYEMAKPVLEGEYAKKKG